LQTEADLGQIREFLSMREALALILEDEEQPRGGERNTKALTGRAFAGGIIEAELEQPGGL